MGKSKAAVALGRRRWTGRTLEDRRRHSAMMHAKRWGEPEGPTKVKAPISRMRTQEVPKIWLEARLKELEKERVEWGKALR